MFQPFLPGLEGTLPFEVAYKSIYNPEQTVKFFESRGFESQGLLNGSAYIPYRIVTPSGVAMDVDILLKELEKEKSGEIVDAYYYWLAVRSKSVGLFDLNLHDNFSHGDFFES